ncbi:MAG TPA: TonB family protein [Rhizomicrobium sp.]|nr:TonB family protein [Rhizomicrobium sp.]
MERPSHIIFDRRQALSRRLPMVAAAIGLQLAGFWLFTHGLATHLPGMIHVLDFVPVPETQKPTPLPPPEPVMQHVTAPVVPLPDFAMAPMENNNSIASQTAQPPSGGNASVKSSAGTDRAATAISSTHTVPSYPPIARRMGEEGKVTLRLTVSAEGRVIQADIVTSSGRVELDQTAQAWIMAHWTYKPALRDGAAVASQVLATVTFSLASER